MALESVMKLLEDLDHIPGDNAVGRLGAFVKTLDRRELKLRDSPGAPGTSLKAFSGRLSEANPRRSIVIY